MKEKNGFVFVESVVVLVVVALSLSMLISSYALVKRKTQEKEYYDKASDKYLLYSLSNLGTDDLCNYGIACNNLSDVSADTYRNSNTTISFRADADNSEGFNCSKSKIGKIIYNCNEVFNDLHLVHLYVVENITDELYGSLDEGSRTTTKFFDSGTIEYMKSMKKCNDLDFNKNTRACNNPITYMIGVFERGANEYYYASIEIASSNGGATIPEIPDGLLWYNRNDNVDIDKQVWYYYENNKPVTGLHKLSVSASNPHKYYYYFDKVTGVMRVGWVYFDESYHLFSPFDYKSLDGTLDGRRVQSCSSDRLKVTINENKDFYLDREGVCYTCQTGSCKCNETDVQGKITSIDISVHDYSCNGDEYNE